jgi:hypothetical protein
MARKLFAAALTLCVAGGVYLSAGPAHASNMGFKLERKFEVVRSNPAVPSTNFLNIYLLSYPAFNGLGDVANDGTTGGTKGCVGDTGGPAAGDGRINAFDSLCDSWTSRNINGAMVVSRFDRDACSFILMSGNKTALAGLQFAGTPFPLEADAGLYITVSSPATPAPTNQAVIVGSHDPSYTGRAIREPSLGPAGRDCAPRQDLINLPYHSMYQKPSEILCGLEGTAWTYTAPNKPSACNAGIFNDTTKKTISVGTFDNIADGSTTTGDNSFAFRAINFNGLTGLTFAGPDYDLTPGDSYIVSISLGHGQTTFLSPHF